MQRYRCSVRVRGRVAQLGVTKPGDGSARSVDVVRCVLSEYGIYQRRQRAVPTLPRQLVDDLLVATPDPSIYARVDLDFVSPAYGAWAGKAASAIVDGSARP